MTAASAGEPTPGVTISTLARVGPPCSSPRACARAAASLAERGSTGAAFLGVALLLDAARTSAVTAAAVACLARWNAARPRNIETNISTVNTAHLSRRAHHAGLSARLDRILVVARRRPRR